MAREMLDGLALLGRELDQLAGRVDLGEQPQDAARARAGHVVEARHGSRASIAAPWPGDPGALGSTLESAASAGAEWASETLRWKLTHRRARRARGGVLAAAC